LPWPLSAGACRVAGHENCDGDTFHLYRHSPILIEGLPAKKEVLGGREDPNNNIGKQKDMNKAVFTMAVLAGTSAAMTATTTVATEPANIQAGAVYLTPTLDLEAGFTDNLFRSAGDEVDTWQTILTPRLQAWMQSGLNTYSLTYKAVDYRYYSSKDDDFTDQYLNLDVYHQFNAKNIVNVFAEYYDGHEERGTGLTDGFGQTFAVPVEYERKTVGGDYSYGNLDSRGRLLLEAKKEQYDYQNFRSVTRFRDRDQDVLGGTFFWAVGARTDVLLQARYIDNEYKRTDIDNPFGSLSSEEFNYLVGMSWDATARISGSAKIGVYDREYESSAREDDDGFQWEVDLTYQPRSYSTVRVESRRYSQETNGLGDSINTDEFKLAWDHNWSSRTSTNLSALVASEDYTGIDREDDRINLEASYNYTPRRWLDIGLGIRYEDRGSDVDFFDYTRNYYFIEAKLSL